MAEKMKNSFVLYTDYVEQIELLTIEQRGVLFTAIMYYETGKELPEMDGITAMAFSFIRQDIDRNNEKWEDIREKRSAAGAKGGAPKGNNNAQKQAKQANDFENKQKQAKQAKQAVNVSVSVSDSVNVNDNVNVTPPTVGVSARACEEQEEEAPSKVLPFTVGQAKRDYVSFYSQNIGVITPIIIDEAETFITDDGIEDGCIVLALKEAVSHGANNWAYAKSILTRWLERGITTEERARSAILEYQRGRAGKPQGSCAPEENEYTKFMRELAEV